MIKIGFTQQEMEAKAAIELIAQLATGVSVEAAAQLVRKIDHVEAFAPLFDPTAYLQVRDNIPDHKKIAKAFLAFRRVLEEFAPPKEEDAP